MIFYIKMKYLMGKNVNNEKFLAEATLALTLSSFRRAVGARAYANKALWGLCEGVASPVPVSRVTTYGTRNKPAQMQRNEDSVLKCRAVHVVHPGDSVNSRVQAQRANEFSCGWGRARRAVRHRALGVG